MSNIEGICVSEATQSNLSRAFADISEFADVSVAKTKAMCIILLRVWVQ